MNWPHNIFKSCSYCKCIYVLTMTFLSCVSRKWWECLDSFWFILLLIVNIHSFIYWWLLRLEVILKLFFILLKLHAHHQCDTLSNGNIVRKKEWIISATFADSMTLCNKGWDDDNGVNLSVRIQAEVSRLDVSQTHERPLNCFCTSKSGMQMHLTWMYYSLPFVCRQQKVFC